MIESFINTFKFVEQRDFTKKLYYADSLVKIGKFQFEKEYLDVYLSPKTQYYVIECFDEKFNVLYLPLCKTDSNTFYKNYIFETEYDSEEQQIAQLINEFNEI